MLTTCGVCGWPVGSWWQPWVYFKFDLVLGNSGLVLNLGLWTRSCQYITTKWINSDLQGFILIDCKSSWDYLWFVDMIWQHSNLATDKVYLYLYLWLWQSGKINREEANSLINNMLVLDLRSSQFSHQLVCNNSVVSSTTPGHSKDWGINSVLHPCFNKSLRWMWQMRPLPLLKNS